MKKIIYITLFIFVYISAESVVFEINGTAENTDDSGAFQSITLSDVWIVSLDDACDPEKWAEDHHAEYLGKLGYLKDHYKFRISGTSILEKAERAKRRIQSDKQVKGCWHQVSKRRFHRSALTEDWVIGDPLFKDQWHLLNTGQNRGTLGADINVTPVWSMGVTGAGVVIGVVDDGLQYTHPDLQENYRSDLSYDFNDGDTDPYPGKYDTHGTPIAGLASAKDNMTCGVGAAFRSSVAGIRLISKTCTDADEAEGLSFKRDDIHIYTSSWGPLDYGSDLEGPGPLTMKAFEDNIINGRNGLGNIYIWAAGNGRERNDNINYDGYANSRFTIAVGSVDQNGVLASYSECGAPLITVTPSKQSSYSTFGIVTTDLLGYQGESTEDCLRSFGGTSASAPILAGVVALMLEANPNLTWRDVQHILIRTAFRNDPDDPEWAVNGFGRAVSHKYGFGRVNAYEAVKTAQSWTRVPDAVHIIYEAADVNLAIPDNDLNGVRSKISVTDTIRLEHVEIVFNAPHQRRGDLKVVLISPSGTESILAETHNDYNKNYDGWTFMTARNWDEISAGVWSLQVSDGKPSYTGKIQSWELKLYGTPYSENLGDTIQILKQITTHENQPKPFLQDWNGDGRIGLEEAIRILQHMAQIDK